MPRIHAIDQDDYVSRFDTYHLRSAIFAAALARGSNLKSERQPGRSAFSGCSVPVTTRKESSCKVEVTRTPLRKKGWANPRNHRRLINYEDLHSNCWVCVNAFIFAFKSLLSHHFDQCMEYLVIGLYMNTSLSSVIHMVFLNRLSHQIKSTFSATHLRYQSRVSFSAS